MGNKSPEERKKELEEALKRVRPQILERKNEGSVQARVNAQASKPNEDENNQKSDKEKARKTTAKDLAKAVQGFERKKEEAKKKGVSLTPNVKGDADAHNDKNKEKSKDKDSKEMTPEKQEQKMKEMFSKVKLPSGMEIHQEGPQWVLVSKDGKQRTDITDVVNTIDRYNRDVDAANSENRMQNNVQSGVDKAADTARKDNMDDNLTKTQAIETALPQVKDVDGNQLFKPEDIKLVAETALQYSVEKTVLEELRDRDNKNQHNADEKKQQQELPPQVRASIGRGGRV